jgi:glycosyltransferase involved in cell wall biosynthesis
MPSSAVTIVTDNFGGGTGRHLIEMLRHRDVMRWPTRILCYGVDDGLRPSEEIPYRRRRFRRSFVRFPLPQLRVLWDLAKELPRERHILHTYFFWPIMYGRILKRLGRVPILVENREDMGFKFGRAHRWALRRLQDQPDLVVCVSHAVRRAAIESEHVPAERITVVENGVELPNRVGTNRTNMRRELGVAPDHLLIGMVANLNRPVKAVDRFIDAIPLVLASVPAARFVIAGDGHLRSELEQQAKRLGVEGAVSFLGTVSEIGRLYDALDISVLTSRSEGLSITLLESMAHGLPVVVTAVGGNPEVVVPGETGLLVPPDDVDSFVTALVKLCHEPEARVRMGLAGRRRCEAQYDIGSVSGRYEGLYASLLGQTD